MTALCCVEGFGGVGGRIIPIIGGACTFGPGLVIDDQLSTTYWNHIDLE